MSKLNREDEVKVTNRSNSTVILKLPDRNFRAELNPKETRILTYGHIVDLVARPGGRELVYNYLLVQNPQMLREGLNVKEEPEYWLTEDKLATWMPSCGLDEFKDALNFAPKGVLDLIKKYAVSLPLKDVDKREAIKTYLGFDVNTAIENNKKSMEDNAAEVVSKRRSSSVSFDIPEDNETPEGKSTETVSKYKRTATTTTI